MNVTGLLTALRGATSVATLMLVEIHIHEMLIYEQPCGLSGRGCGKYIKWLGARRKYTGASISDGCGGPKSDSHTPRHTRHTHTHTHTRFCCTGSVMNECP